MWVLESLLQLGCDPFRAQLSLEAVLVLSVGSGAGAGGGSQKLGLYFGYSSLKNEYTIRQRKKSNEIKNGKFLELNGHSLRLREECFYSQGLCSGRGKVRK